MGETTTMSNAPASLTNIADEGSDHQGLKAARTVMCSFIACEQAVTQRLLTYQRLRDSNHPTFLPSLLPVRHQH